MIAFVIAMGFLSLTIMGFALMAHLKSITIALRGSERALEQISAHLNHLQKHGITTTTHRGVDL